MTAFGLLPPTRYIVKQECDRKIPEIDYVISDKRLANLWSYVPCRLIRPAWLLPLAITAADPFEISISGFLTPVIEYGSVSTPLQVAHRQVTAAYVYIPGSRSPHCCRNTNTENLIFVEACIGLCGGVYLRWNFSRYCSISFIRYIQYLCMRTMAETRDLLKFLVSSWKAMFIPRTCSPQAHVECSSCLGPWMGWTYRLFGGDLSVPHRCPDSWKVLSRDHGIC